jgi:glycosyltransferase involved in cell wall biosynthesis
LATRIMVLGLRALTGAQGGIETHVRTLVTAIASSQDEFQFEVLERQPYAGAKPPCANVKLISLWSPKRSSLETLVHSIIGVGYAAVTRPDLLHLHGIGPSLVAPLARGAGLKVVSTHHGEDYDRDKWGPFAKMTLRLGEVLAMRFSNTVIAIAPGLADRLRAKYRRDIAYIPNPIPRLAPALDDNVLSAHGLSPKSYFLHVGRVVPEKRQLELIEAYRTLANTDWPLVLVGAADHESPYSQSVLALAKTVPNVLFLGTQHGGALSTLFAQAGGFILPSSHEGLPIVLLEAMHFGRPVALSDIRNLTDLHLPADCYFDASSSTATVEALRRLRGADARVVNWSSFLENFELQKIRDLTISSYKN